MAAGTYDIVCEQGASFTREFVWQDENESPIVLTGFTARMDVRATVAASDPIISLTTTNTRITLTPAIGKITLVLTATDTAALPARRAVYDLELVSPSGVVTRLLQGKFTVSPEVTR